MFLDFVGPNREIAGYSPGADGWVLQDADGTVLSIHSTAEKLYGWDSAVVTGEASAQMVHPEDRAVVARLRNAAREGAGDQWIQFRVRSRNGRWLWVDGGFRAVTDANGVCGRLTVLSLRDVSANYLDREVVELVVELRALIAAESNVGDAWIAGLARTARLAHCCAALVWEETDAGLSAEHVWADDTDAEHLVVARRAVVGTDRAAGALGKAWRTGDVIHCRTAQVCGVDHASTISSQRRSLLIPIRSDSITTGVVELVSSDRQGGRRPTDLVAAVVGQLGDLISHKRFEEQLAIAEQRFRLTFDEAVVGMALVAPDGALLAANQALCNFLGRDEGQLRDLGFDQLTYPADLGTDEVLIDDVLNGSRSTYQIEKRYVHSDGGVKWALLSVSLVRDHNGAPLHFISQINDINARKHFEMDLTRAVATFRAAFDDSGIGMALVQLDGEEGRLLETNEAFAAITGRTQTALRTHLLSDVIDSADTDRLAGHLDRISHADAPAQRDELRIVRADGTTGWIKIVAAPVRDYVSGSRVAVVQIEDITAQRHAQQKLAHVAVHDALTGLPNRLLITDRIRNAQQRSERSGLHLGILFIDLDKFKNINDSLGHDAGDQLLTEVANRFHDALRPSDTAARIGGDEFVVLCDELSHDIDAATMELERVADRLHETLHTPIEIGGADVFITASIGMNVVEGANEEVRTTISNADIAMYRAKARGRSRSEPYDSAVRREAIDRLRLGTDLRRAVDRDELTVVYQPIVELPSGIVRGAEALLRWSHPEFGEIPPTEFISIAEDSELIVILGDFVIEQVCQHLQSLDAADYYVSANVSASQLSRSNFVETVNRGLEDHQLRPDQLALEITENVLMDAAGSSLSQLNELHALGVGVGVDDFGTGYASLTYLKQLPVSFVKIDRSFTDGVVNDSHDRMITNAVIGLANALELDVIAEGVETAGQVSVLCELGCAHAQGFLFGRPLPAP